MMSEHDYLVNYGQNGYLGRFRASDSYCRDDLVVVRTERGVELGRVLTLAPQSNTAFETTGNVLRPASEEDLEAANRMQDRVKAVLGDAQSLAESFGLPLAFLDGEIPLDGRDAILHAVHWSDCDATPLFEELSRKHGLTVKLADLTTAPKQSGCSVCGAEKSGCDSCGTGGGCSSGSCSSGAVKSADELTAYFAGLRKQMEAMDQRVSLH